MVHDFEVTDKMYDYSKFDEILGRSKGYLSKLNPEKRLEIIRELLKNPNFDDTDIYYLTMCELQKSPNKPPEHRERVTDLVSLNREAPKNNVVPVALSSVEPKKYYQNSIPDEREETHQTEEDKTVEKSKEIGPKRPCGDMVFGEEDEEKDRRKKRVNRKQWCVYFDSMN